MKLTPRRAAAADYRTRVCRPARLDTGRRPSSLGPGPLTSGDIGAVPAYPKPARVTPDCFRTGLPTSFVEIAAAGCWPRFAAATGEVGFAAVHAMLLRPRAEVIGSLNLMRAGGLPVVGGRGRVVEGGWACAE